jgi:pimeloyl-ACP methyl ester carboxylesterase
MRFTSETTSNGVLERLFSLDDIPGVLWSPADGTGSRPLVLLGHGGGQHKRAPGLVARPHRYVTACGFAVAAIDAPGHGDRPRTEHDERFAAGIRERMAAGESIGPQIARDNAERAARAVPEWQATLDALQDLDYVGADGPVGFWGVSLGSAIGVPLAPSRPRQTAKPAAGRSPMPAVPSDRGGTMRLPAKPIPCASSSCRPALGGRGSPTNVALGETRTASRLAA